jgi:hypothetical protein
MEKLWLLLACVVVVGYFSYRDSRRIKLHDSRNATGHCALCANKLEYWRVRDLRYRYTNTGPSKVVKVCAACFDRKKRIRLLMLAALILVIVALLMLRLVPRT